MPPARQLVHWIGRLAPPLALMGVIFYLSAQQDLGTGLGTADLILRKLAHMTEYALLWILWLRAFGWQAPWAAAAIAIGYAMTDELHQTLVPTRNGSPVDVAIDSAGVLIAALVFHRLGLAQRLRERDARRRDRDGDAVAAG